MAIVFEIALHTPLIGAIAAGVYALRRAQPDPNPAILAREAADLRAGIVPVPRVERRIHPLPYIGRDRRDEGTQVAAAWRRSA